MNAAFQPTPALPNRELAELLAGKGQLPLGSAPRAKALAWLRTVLVHRPALVAHFAHLQESVGSAAEHPPQNAWEREQLLAEVVARAGGFRPREDWDCLEAILSEGPASLERLPGAESLLLDAPLLYAIADAIDEDIPPAWTADLEMDLVRLGVRGAAIGPGKPASRFPRREFAIAASAALLVGGLLIGRWTDPARSERDDLARQLAAADEERSRLGNRLAQLESEAGRLQKGLEAAKPLIFTSGGSGAARAPKWIETWARRYSESNTATENLNRLEPFATPEIVNLIQFLRAGNRTDAEIIKAIEPPKAP